MERNHEKALIRADVLRRREQLPPRVRQAASDQIAAMCLAQPTVTMAPSIFIYVSTATEVATHALIDQLLARGHVVLVPSLPNRAEMIAVRFPGWARMQPGVLGILTPPPQPAWPRQIDLVIVPGVAFSAAGARLGYGGGYYDRWLALHPATIPIALAFDLQVVDHLPTTPRDVLMPTIITESRNLGSAQGKLD